MMDTSDLVARARGLSGHLLRPEQIAPLCACSPAQLGAQLSALGAIEAAAGAAAGTSRDPHELEQALRARAAQRLLVLARWAGARAGALQPLFDDEDMRSLRALVRGIVTGVPPEHRADGLIPTLALPARALRSLAASGDVANLANLLVTWRNPYGAALAVEAARSRPELFRFDAALARVFAERARSASRHDSMLRRFTERTVDLANLWTALVLADHHADADPATLFVSGGRLMRLEDLAFAVSAEHQLAVAQRLGPRVVGTPLAAALETITSPAVTAGRDAEDAALAALAAEFRALARQEPTSLAPVVAFVLQQRAELRMLLRIVWSVSLGIPAVNIRQSAGVAA